MSAKATSSDEGRPKQINLGLIETRNLSECLQVDFASLYNSIFPDATESVRYQIRELQSLGIVKRMSSIADLIWSLHGTRALQVLESHPSDTARSWAAFIFGQLPSVTLPTRLDLIKKFADDTHFGVREWAWMAVRNHIAEDLECSIKHLSGWALSTSPRIRRFASEATRPRGVWASHIQALKTNPEIALSILTPLKNDPDRYVQDSVANWLNDAAKSQPDWVTKLCRQWAKESDTKAAAYIIKKAQRSIKL